MTLLQVASGRGVAVLPDRVPRALRFHSDHATKRQAGSGLTLRATGRDRAGEAATALSGGTLP